MFGTIIKCDIGSNESGEDSSTPQKVHRPAPSAQQQWQQQQQQQQEEEKQPTATQQFKFNEAIKINTQERNDPLDGLRSPTEDKRGTSFKDVIHAKAVQALEKKLQNETDQSMRQGIQKQLDQLRAKGRRYQSGNNTTATTAHSNSYQTEQPPRNADPDASLHNELDGLISQFVSPISDKIFMDYDPGLRKKKEAAQMRMANQGQHDLNLETMLEHEQNDELQGHVYMELLVHIYQSINFLQNLEIPEEQIIEKQIEVEFKKKHITKLLLLDLDETLIHCVKKPNPQRAPMVKIDITTPNGNVIKDVGFNIRPKCRELLEAANRCYEVCVFTASTPQYADSIINHIDPTGKLIQHRFYRSTCVKTEGGEYIKDLRVFKNIDLKNILLVDNAVYSFGQQLANGIPIASFKEDPEDREFDILIPYLEQCAKHDDVREYNSQKFQLQELLDTPFNNWIEYYYDMEDCQALMEEERTEVAESKFTNKGFEMHEPHYIASSTGGRSSHAIKKPFKMPPKSVDECLDGINSILRNCGGKLPIDFANSD